MAKQPHAPLSESEVDQLDAFLANLNGPIRSIEGLDGMLCALNCAPTEVAQSDYMGAVLGGDPFDSAQQGTEINKLIQRHDLSVAEELQRAMETEDFFTPALMVDEDGNALGNEWALGFLLGISMTQGDWAAFAGNQKLAQLMTPMMVLAHERHPDPAMRPSPIPDDARDELLQMMAGSAAIIYGYFNGKPLPPH